MSPIPCKKKVPELEENVVSVVTNELVGDKEQFMRRDLGRLAVKSSDRHGICAQVYSWGRNESSVLGVGSNQMSDFDYALTVPIWGILAFARVFKVSCGYYHCAALTDMGLVYTWGNGTDGALGQGNENDSEIPRMVSALGSQEPPTLIIDVSCGSDLAGSHTACVSREGEVYTWGIGHAIGNGHIKSQNLPVRLASDSFDGNLVDTISCGGSFCVALTSQGFVYSWGAWLHGRLGLGTPPPRKTKKRRNRASPDDTPGMNQYCTRPKRVTGGAIGNSCITKVDCGEAHVLAVDGTGRLFAWGKGAQGQLGSGQLFNVMVPQVVDAYLCKDTSTTLEWDRESRIVAVCCGSNHSLAMDNKNNIYSWGGLGSAAIGQGSSITNWDIRVKGSFVADNKTLKKLKESGKKKQDAKEVVSIEEKWAQNTHIRRSLEDEQPWRWPRRIDALSGLSIKLLSAGERHSAGVTKDGSVYVWGQNGCRNGASCAEPRLLKDSKVVGQFVECVSCGSGHTTIVASGSTLAEPFRILYNKLQSPRWSSTMLSPPDLQLVVGTDILYAHKVIVGARSGVLRKLIELEEENVQDPEEDAVRLILPEISPEAARLMLEYIYGDNIYTALDPVDTVQDELKKIAFEFDMKRLEAICVRSQAVPTTADADVDGDSPFSENDRALLVEDSLLESGFAKDLGKLVNEPLWSDLTMLTSDGKTIHAHSVILSTRSTYFDRVIAKNGENGQLELSDPLDPVLRLLTYIYSGGIDQNKATIFDDVRISHKYNLSDMQRICEDTIELSVENALKALLTAKQVCSHRLEDRALHFIVLHLDSLSQTKSFLKFQKHDPQGMTKLLAYIQASNNSKTIITQRSIVPGEFPEEDDPVWLLKQVLKTDEERVQEQLDNEKNQLFVSPDIDWRVALFIGLCILCYVYILSDPAYMVFAPVANGLAIAISLFLAVQTLST
mmetsp:Transcript_17705/g.38750  ORF Transcript_17705/g.38750 Transcript_17705/m.38750 type:complete len:951 (-) Transcript_17705:1419-4271(-)